MVGRPARMHGGGAFFGAVVWPTSKIRQQIGDIAGLRARKRPLPKKGPVRESFAFTGFSDSAGGGTRTPDTRIMIPLL